MMTTKSDTELRAIKRAAWLTQDKAYNAFWDYRATLSWDEACTTGSKRLEKLHQEFVAAWDRWELAA